MISTANHGATRITLDGAVAAPDEQRNQSAPTITFPGGGEHAGAGGSAATVDASSLSEAVSADCDAEGFFEALLSLFQ